MACSWLTTLRNVLLGTTVFAYGACVTSSAMAQGAAPAYKQDPIATDRAARSENNKLRSWVFSVLRGESMTGREADFDRFWNEVFTAEMTQISGISQLGDNRDKFRNARRAAVNNPAVLSHLNQLLLNRMQQIVADNYHPYVRYHALLMIGDLNEREAATNQTAVPYKPAFPVLMQALQSNELPDGLKVAALRGVMRHTEAGGLSNADATAVRDFALALLNQKKSPEGRTQEVHDWLRGRAADLLAMQRDPGQGGAVLSALDAVIADSAASLPVRTSAAKALSSLNYGNAGRQDPTLIVKHLGTVAVEAYRKELATFADNEEKASARRLLHQLKAVADGLGTVEQKNGIAGLAQDQAQQQLVSSVASNLNAMMKQAEKDPLTKSNVDSIYKSGEALAALVGVKPAVLPTGKPVPSRDKTKGNRGGTATARRSQPSKGPGGPAITRTAAPVNAEEQP